MNAVRGFVGRLEELRRLEAFVRASGPGFLHLRGRRRIGKSWLLAELLRRREGIHFQGEADSTTKQLQLTMAGLWDGYSGRKNLSLIRQRDLTWEIIFDAIADYARRRQDRTVVL